jgi:hypothetical protein
MNMKNGKSDLVAMTGHALRALMARPARPPSAAQLERQAAIARTPIEALGLRMDDNAPADDDAATQDVQRQGSAAPADVTGPYQDDHGDAELLLPAAVGCAGDDDAPASEDAATRDVQRREGSAATADGTWRALTEQLAHCRAGLNWRTGEQFTYSEQLALHRAPGAPRLCDFCGTVHRVDGTYPLCHSDISHLDHTEVHCPRCGGFWFRRNTRGALLEDDEELTCCWHCRRGWNDPPKPPAKVVPTLDGADRRYTDAGLCPPDQSDWADRSNWVIAIFRRERDGEFGPEGVLHLDDVRGSWVRAKLRREFGDGRREVALPDCAAEKKAQEEAMRFAKRSKLRREFGDGSREVFGIWNYSNYRYDAYMSAYPDSRHRAAATFFARARPRSSGAVPRLFRLPIPRAVWRGAARAAAVAARAAVLVAEGSWPGDPRPAISFSEGSWPPAEEMYAEWKLDVGITSAIRSAHNFAGHRVVARWERSRRDPRLDLLELPDGVDVYSAAKARMETLGSDARHDELAKADGLMVNSFMTAPNEHLLSWEQRARALAASQSVDAADGLNREDPALILTTHRWERHMLQLSWLTDQFCHDLQRYWDLYLGLRRLQFKLLAMADTQRSVLERCDGDTEAAMRRNKEAWEAVRVRYWGAVRSGELAKEEAVRVAKRSREEAVCVAKRDRERARRSGSLVGGRLAVLPACTGQYRCVICSYVAPNRKLCSQHVRRKHDSVEAKRSRFVGREKNAHGARQYALCVCSADGPCTAGTKDWVRHPDAPAWQASLIRGGATSRTV